MYAWIDPVYHKLFMLDILCFELYFLLSADVRKFLKQKEARDLKRLQKALSQEEFNAAMVNQNSAERMRRLDEGYKLLESEYSKVLDRLATI